VQLREEEELMDNKLRPYELDHTHGIASHPRKKQYRDNDEAIRQLVIAYDNQQEAERNVVNHVQSLQFRLAKAKYDNDV
jgi:hypothetical protein